MAARRADGALGHRAAGGGEPDTRCARDGGQSHESRRRALGPRSGARHHVRAPPGWRDVPRGLPPRDGVEPSLAVRGARRGPWFSGYAGPRGLGPRCRRDRGIRSRHRRVARKRSPGVRPPPAWRRPRRREGLHSVLREAYGNRGDLAGARALERRAVPPRRGARRSRRGAGPHRGRGDRRARGPRRGDREGALALARRRPGSRADRPPGERLPPARDLARPARRAVGEGARHPRDRHGLEGLRVRGRGPDRDRPARRRDSHGARRRRGVTRSDA